MRLYLSGPMRGYPDHNRLAFGAAALLLRRMGHTVVSPSELDDAAPIATASDDAPLPYIIRDLQILRDGGFDAIAFLPGWRDSQGCKSELLAAHMLGLTTYAVKTPDMSLREIEAEVLVHARLLVTP